MPVLIQCEDLSLSYADVATLWCLVFEKCQYDDEEITIRCVSKDEIRRLNKKYRGKDAVTNILTFSYGDEIHDVALCLDVAREEAALQDIVLTSYIARLLVHAFLHVVGMDHEVSDHDAEAMSEMECFILSKLDYGFCGILSNNDKGMDKK